MSADWHALGDTNVHYRKWQSYNFDWKDLEGNLIEFDEFLVCGALFAGPVVLYYHLFPQNAPRKFYIFSSAGSCLAELPWEDKKLAGIGWNDQEQLITVLEDGNVLMYDIHGKILRNFLLLDVMSNSHVLECRFWGNGVVAMTSDIKLYVAEGISSPDLNAPIRKYTLQTGLSPERSYTAFAIVHPLLTRSGLLEVILGTVDNSVLVIDENEIEDQLLQDRINSQITKIAVTPNGRFFAFYCKNGILSVLSSTFTTKVLDFDTKSVTKPLDIAWCGDDSVLLLWKNTGIVMVGPFGDWLNFAYEDSVHLVQESDCCRIFTSNSCEMLQRVPESTESIRKIGSTDPAALLYDAMEAFEDGDPKSDEHIRSIAASNQLVDAVQSCINAASMEFDVSRQQAFMKAASYGKAFCMDFDSNEFVDVARKLRVLNAVRISEIGIPLTLSQYNRLTPEVLVSRLTLRNHHYLALKICESLKLKNERVLVHWACEKVKKMAVQTQFTDEAIRDVVRNKLESYSRISYLEICNAAYQMGRRRLATMILDMEQHAADQVPLLLSMQEEELALQKAINSEDTDLIYLTLIHLEKSRGDPEGFHRIIYSHAEAANLLKMYYRIRVKNTDKSILHDLLVYGKNYLEAGISAVNQAYQGQNPQSKSNGNVQKSQLLKEASALFGQGAKALSSGNSSFGLLSSDLAFHKAVTDEHIELMEIQKTLELRCDVAFVDLSLAETLSKLVQLSMGDSKGSSAATSDTISAMTSVMSLTSSSSGSKWESEISKIVKKFKVSDKMLWNIKIKCYADAGQWPLLLKLANEKKSPIGYKPFAYACIDHAQPASEVEKYIEKITVLEDKYDLYMDVQSWRKAYEVALKLKDGSRLFDVQRLCRDPALEKLIQDTLAKL